MGNPWWWPGRNNEQEPPPSRRFGCPHCKQEVLLEHVLSAERIIDHETLMAKVQVVLLHPCREFPRRVTYSWDDDALRRLFGGDYYMPYPRPMGSDEEGEAVDSPPAPAMDKESLLARWRWELSQCASARDFLLFCRGPREDL